MGKIIFAIIVFVALMALVAYWMIAAARRNSCRKSLSGSTCSQVKQRVRVAYISSNAILLCPRDESAALRGDNLDLPFETLIGRHEKVEHALARMFAPLYRENPPEVRFCLKHVSNCDDGFCENYLFVVWCGDEEIPPFVNMNYKLWTRRQIEANMGKGLFSKEFEEEYPHLRLVVDTWTMVHEGKV